MLNRLVAKKKMEHSPIVLLTLSADLVPCFPGAKKKKRFHRNMLFLPLFAFLPNLLENITNPFKQIGRIHEAMPLLLREPPCM